MATPLELVLDGYSVLHARHTSGFSSPDEIRQKREQLLRDLMRITPQPADCIHVVFDGKGEQVDRDSPVQDRLNVVFSKGGQTADALIESLATRHPDPSSLWIVSNDRAILDLAAAQHCRVESASEFVRATLDTKPRLHSRLKSPPPKRPTLGDLFPPGL